MQGEAENPNPKKHYKFTMLQIIWRHNRDSKLNSNTYINNNTIHHFVSSCGRCYRSPCNHSTPLLATSVQISSHNLPALWKPELLRRCSVWHYAVPQNSGSHKYIYYRPSKCGRWSHLKYFSLGNKLWHTEKTSWAKSHLWNKHETA